MRPQALDKISPDMAVTDVAEALRLNRHADGHFETDETSGQRLVLLGAGDLFAWQRQTAPTSWTWLAGAALALSVSAAFRRGRCRIAPRCRAVARHPARY